MWFREDKNTVHTEIIHSEDIDFEIAVRFGSSRLCPGSQTYDGRNGWFCTYIVMRDADFERISGRLSINGCGFPELDVPGGTSYFNKVPLFNQYSDEGFTVIGWDYNHGEPWEKDATLGSVIGDAKKAVGQLSGLFHDRIAQSAL